MSLSSYAILCVPVCFGVATLWLYFLSINLPSIRGDNSSQLRFPKNLEDIIQIAAILNRYKSEHLFYVVVLFCSAYIYKQTFAIPGSVALNLLAGALFGIFPGFPLVCALTATGATFCYLLSNFFGKAYVIKYFPEKVKSMQDKVKENSDGLLFFLLFLRLFPASPNWFLNIVSPILNIKIHLFFLSVFIGLMPYNFICVQTGCMLTEISSMDDIYTYGTFLKLLAIALFALVPGYIMKKLKAKRDKTILPSRAKSN